MPVKARVASSEQLELFRPKRTRPSWRALPEVVRKQVRELLSQMLAEHVEGSAKCEMDEETDDE